MAAMMETLKSMTGNRSSNRSSLTQLKNKLKDLHFSYCNNNNYFELGKMFVY